MTGKNVAARIVKLEARRQRPNELLLVWRSPNSDAQGAVSAANFASGDRVICLEWFGEDTLPPPKWYRNRLSSELGAVENDYLTRSLEWVGDDRERDTGFAEHQPLPANRARELTDNDLLHMVFGVAT